MTKSRGSFKSILDQYLKEVRLALEESARTEKTAVIVTKIDTLLGLSPKLQLTFDANSSFGANAENTLQALKEKAAEFDLEVSQTGDVFVFADTKPQRI